ncbi:MAG: glycosyltransferase family 4 protein [Candidatus Odinarchaeota archaeon]
MKNKVFQTNLGIKISKKYNNSFLDKIPRFIFIGKLDRNKNPLMAIKIISQLISSNYKVEFSLWGDGKLKDEVLMKLKDLRDYTSTKVEYQSRVSHNMVIRKIKEFDCFIMTSLSEGTPLSLLEAMSHGLICFVTPVGGIKNIIINEYNGVFIDINNIGETVNKIIKILSDKGKREEIRKNAINTIKKFYSPDVLLKRYMRITLDEKY